MKYDGFWKDFGRVSFLALNQEDTLQSSLLTMFTRVENNVFMANDDACVISKQDER